MKVHTMLRKLSISMEIGVITSSQTTTFQPTTHLFFGTIKTCLMEVECSRVQDQLRIFRTMLHLVSKDNNKVFREQTIKDKGDPNPLKIK